MYLEEVLAASIQEGLLNELSKSEILERLDEVDTDQTLATLKSRSSQRH